jgi:hypothetical protein
MGRFRRFSDRWCRCSASEDLHVPENQNRSSAKTAAEDMAAKLGELGVPKR